MTPITPRNIIRHELIGLEARVSKSTHRGYVGIRGLVVDETRNMLVIETERGRKMVPKAVSTFRFRLPDGTVVEVDGKLLVGRPEDRVKRRVKRLW